MRRDPQPYAKERSAAPEDLAADVLVNEWGLLRATSPEAREVVAKHGQICRVAPGYCMYLYGIPCDPTTFYVVLEGLFAAEHPHPRRDGTMVFHSYYGPGHVFGEVEVLCRDLVIELPNGETPQADVTRGQITCVHPGRLLRLSPAEQVLAIPQVRLNLARQLCYKLLATGAFHDQQVPPRFQVLLYLQARLDSQEFQPCSEVKGAGPELVTEGSLCAPISQSRVAKECNLPRQTVGNIFGRMKAEPGFIYAKRSITIPHPRFFQDLQKKWNQRAPRSPAPTRSKVAGSKAARSKPS